jgi:hypothetical protein
MHVFSVYVHTTCGGGSGDEQEEDGREKNLSS